MFWLYHRCVCRCTFLCIFLPYSVHEQCEHGDFATLSSSEPLCCAVKVDSSRGSVLCCKTAVIREKYCKPHIFMDTVFITDLWLRNVSYSQSHFCIVQWALNMYVIYTLHVTVIIFTCMLHDYNPWCILGLCLGTIQAGWCKCHMVEKLKVYNSTSCCIIMCGCLIQAWGQIWNGRIAAFIVNGDKS